VTTWPPPFPPSGPPGPSSSSAAASPPPPSATQPQKPRRRPIVLVLVIVALVVLAGLGIAFVWIPTLGLCPGCPPKTPPLSETTYSVASTEATEAADAHGGTWGVVYAVGLNGPSSLSRPFIGDNGGSYCSFQSTAGSQNVTIPAASGNRSAGGSPYWAFVLRNSSGAILGVSVTGGSASVFGTGNLQCGLHWGSPLETLPVSTMNSTTAMNLANAAGGSAFLRNNTSASVTMEVEASVTGSQGNSPTWTITYSTCSVDTEPPGPGGPLISYFTVYLNWSGTELGYGYGTGPESCLVPLGTPPGGLVPVSMKASIDLGASANFSGTDAQISVCATASCNFYNFTIESADVNLFWDDMVFTVMSPTGATVPVTGGVAAVDQSELFYYSNFTSFPLVPQSSQIPLMLDVMTAETVSLFEAGGSALAGDTLAITGIGMFGGTVEFPIT
jgi:hypothetical protein